MSSLQLISVLNKENPYGINGTIKAAFVAMLANKMASLGPEQLLKLNETIDGLMGPEPVPMNHPPLIVRFEESQESQESESQAVLVAQEYTGPR